MSDNGKWLLMFLVTMLSVIIPVIIFGISRENKCLNYEVISGNIISKSDIINTENVKVLFKEEKLKNLDFQLIKITNDGKVPIKKQDFDRELTINYPKGTRVLLANVWRTKPLNLEVKINAIENEVKVEPLLLNKDEQFTVQVLTTDVQSEPAINARITGLDYIKNNTPKTSNTNLRLSKFLVIASVAGFVYGATAFLMICGRKIIIPKFLMILIVISSCMGSVFANNKYSLYKNLDYFSWPLILLFASVALGFIYSIVVLLPRSQSNNRINQN